jgi:MarR family transcriptional regulator, organic hydroperoxide resistance regulator
MKNEKEKTASRIGEYFQGCLYFSAGRLFRLVDSLAAESFRPLKIAPSQAFLLMALSESPECQATPSELAGIMNLDRSTVTRLIISLEHRSCVQRTKSGRHTAIQLLDAGRKLLPEIHTCWETLYLKYCRVLGKKTANTLNRCLVKTTKEINQI